MGRRSPRPGMVRNRERQGPDWRQAHSREKERGPDRQRRCDRDRPPGQASCSPRLVDTLDLATPNAGRGEEQSRTEHGHRGRLGHAR